MFSNVLPRKSHQTRSRAQGVNLAPVRTIVLGFGSAIGAGTALLMLPISSPQGHWTSFVDALFTSTSAVCVTGLVVVDTPTHWSVFGQVVILLLIQLGGLGILLFAALIGLALIRKLSVRSRLAVGTEAKSSGEGDTARLAKGILITSLLIEGVVALVLTVRFVIGYGYTWGDAAWHGVFHSVSSFNNAGFALYSDNLRVC